jgi:hypothetical protein
MEVSIYTPEPSARVFRFHINQITGRIIDNWKYFHDVDEFKLSTGRRIACFQIPYPWDSRIEQQIDEVYNSVDYILIIGSELHAKTVEFIRRFDQSKITYFICGQLNQPMSNSRICKFLDWFTTSVFFYKHVRPSVLQELNAYESKPLMFDALLGRKKPHRDLAYNFIQENNLDTHGILTYLDAYQAQLGQSNPAQWQWESAGINNLESHINNIQYTVDRINYYGYHMSVSQIIPINVYNQTAYTLVCETNTDNEFVFFTEKTVKPILARRLFITLGNRYHLAALRDLGFKTFDKIIDESYDAIENPTARHTAALEQLKWLCDQDQLEILKQVKEITDYNYNLMLSQDWYNEFKQNFGDFFFEHPSRYN